MQQIGDSADRVTYPVLFVNMSNYRFSIGQNMFFKITFKFAHLMLVEFWLCSRIVVVHQRLETALLITLEILTGNIFVKEKNLRCLSR